MRNNRAFQLPQAARLPRRARLPFPARGGARLIIGALLLAACAPAAPSSAPPSAAAVEAKVLATVHLSPTPDAAQAQATLLAQRAAAATPAPSPTPTPTVYVGVFLQGEAAQGGIPLIDPTLIGLPAQPPTPQPPDCPSLPVDERLGTAWLSDAVASGALGCPIEVAIPFTGVIQVFERGVMYYQPGGAVWAVAPGYIAPGRYWTFPRELPPVDPGSAGIVPPAGLRLPEGALASVYFGVEGVRDALGYARLPEEHGSLIYQRFANGTVLVDLASGQAFILAGGDTAYGPF